MFTGTWKESQESLIKLEIPDENIDEEGKIVQPCFYESRFIHNLSEFSHGNIAFFALPEMIKQNSTFPTQSPYSE